MDMAHPNKCHTGIIGLTFLTLLRILVSALLFALLFALLLTLVLLTLRGSVLTLPGVGAVGGRGVVGHLDDLVLHHLDIHHTLGCCEVHQARIVRLEAQRGHSRVVVPAANTPHVAGMRLSLPPALSLPSP